MDKLVTSMEEHFIPIASKIGTQRYLVAIRDSFMVSIPLMVLGALTVMISNLPIPGFQELMNSILGGESWKRFGAAAWNGTFAIPSVLIAFLFTYHLANDYREDGVSAGVTSLDSLFTLDGALSMSSNGLFTVIIVRTILTEIFVRLSGNEKLITKMPDGVPPAVAKIFASLLPAMITTSALALVVAIFTAFGINDITSSFYTVVRGPFVGFASSHPSALLLAFITPFLQFFGLHGANMVDPSMQIINTLAIEVNVSTIAVEHSAPSIVNKPSFDSLANLGGISATLGLLLATYSVGRKNKPYMVVTDLLTTPGVFNISELTMFGLSVVLNPVMFIPFILTPIASVSVTYSATSTGLVPAATATPPWVAPLIIGGVLAIKSIAGDVLVAVNSAPSILIYLPFVKVATIQERRKETLDA